MELKELHVYREVFQQPALWKTIYTSFVSRRKEMAGLLKSISDADGEVIFTGAGSSFFVGEMVAGFFQKLRGNSSKAVSSTELVTYPTHYINKNRKTLLVSFARSGNSPESIAAAELAQQINPNIIHLIITCNSEGELARTNSLINRTVYLLPEEANDKALAMTSSVTSMALVAILLAHIDDIDNQKGQIEIAAALAQRVLFNYEHELETFADIDFERVVFLGSGPFYGLAHEAHLKVQEMTDGQLICKFDSFLGFRHGPKAVVNDRTLMVYFHSPDSHIRKYEDDLVASIVKEQNPAFTFAVCDSCNGSNEYDFVMNISPEKTEIGEDYLMLVYLLPIQLYSIFKSIKLKLNPDSPSKSGAIHRVVQGVKIYDY